VEAQGLLAVCIQHEMDHLRGKVFVEYLSPSSSSASASSSPSSCVEAPDAREDGAHAPPGSMRIVFAGTPAFAASVLARLLMPDIKLRSS
jgi:hypothetical protein